MSATSNASHLGDYDRRVLLASGMDGLAHVGKEI
jgi:hypothetical protein